MSEFNIVFENSVEPYSKNLLTKMDEWGVTVNTYQLALQIVLEALGSRTLDLVACMSVTSSPEALAAVLRAGAQPLLLDINTSTLQMDLEALKEIVPKLENVVVITSYPTDQGIRDFLVENEIIEICDTRMIPNIKDPLKPKAQIEIWDLAPYILTGAVIFTEFPDLKEALIEIRSGVLGHSAHLTTTQLHKLTSEAKIEYWSNLENIYHEYENFGDIANEVQKFKVILGGRYPLAIVKDAAKTIKDLSDKGIEAKLGCYPLFAFPDILARWADSPDYPGAYEMQNKVVALPIGLKHYDQRPIDQQVMDVLDAVEDSL